MPNASRYVPFTLPLAVVVHHVSLWGGEKKLGDRGSEFYFVTGHELPGVLEDTIRQAGSERFRIPRNLLNRSVESFLAVNIDWRYPTFVSPEFATT